jgi:hypothetical protein
MLGPLCRAIPPGDVYEKPQRTQKLSGRPVSRASTQPTIGERELPGSGKGPADKKRNRTAKAPLSFHRPIGEAHMGRSLLLWLLGIPIPIIILLALFWR